MTFISYAQNFEDVLLWRALGSVGCGYYIDVGAHHPDIDSVTRAFYDRGWRGLNIEPLAEESRLLRAARPRDVTIQAAVGDRDGVAAFHVVEGTGLSTLDPVVAASYADRFAVRRTTIPVATLATLCAEHAAAEIHFLKIDVEGAERAVIAGADLIRFRPWIILAESTAPLSTEQTHHGWEPMLLDAGYVHVWFDGLNRFYVAGERAEQLSPAFQVPLNVFDDFLRAADHSWIERAAVAESERDSLCRQVVSAQAALLASAAREQRNVEHTGHEHARLSEALARIRTERAEDRAERDTLRALLHESRHELQHTHLRLQSTERRVQQAEREAGTAEDQNRILRESRSWRLTAPIRLAARRARMLAGTWPAHGTVEPAPPTAAPLVEPFAGTDTPGPVAEAPAAEPIPAEPPPLPVTPPPPFRLEAPPAGALTTVHQYHPGSAVGDAITNALLLIRGLLRAMGYASEIYTDEPPEALAKELHPVEALPRHDRYVLLVHHSMGYDRFEQILALTAPKVLMYHNITPPELLARHPYLQRYAILGRAQLAAFRGHVSSALADSDYNAIELRRLGFAPARACTLLFDPAALQRRADSAAGDGPRRHGVLTILFVGRINESKGQLALLDAYAVFRERYGQPSRLVLVGRDDGETDPYLRALRRRIEEAGLAAHVVLAGAVADDTLDGWYDASDLYVSLSRHEGFGVTLVEAMIHGLPIVAYPGGAVPYTVGDGAILLADPSPDAVAAAMFALATDPAARETQRRAQRAVLRRFDLSAQATILHEALLRAGAAMMTDHGLPDQLAANLRLSIAGHVNGSYSLAVINRELALRLETARPGHVRLLPVEGVPTTDLSGVPAAQIEAIERLVARPPHPTGPELVISQHYPVHVPLRPGDAAVALFFWEESRIPAATIDLLGEAFDAVVAPTRFVRDALIGSGLRIPIRVIPPAINLSAYLALADDRVASPGLHRFLHVSSCFPRKGVDVLLRAWARAFTAADPVRLTIKGFPNPHNDVEAALAALRAAYPDLAPVELVNRDLDPDALLALYRDADTMVLPTLGEGYNLPAAEALAGGLSLIVTGAGGHMDFCAPGGVPRPGVRLLDYDLAPARTHLSTPHSLWFEPVEDDLVAALRDLATRPVASPEASLPPLEPDPASLATSYSALAIDLLLAPIDGRPRISLVTSWQVRCGVAEYSRQLVAGFGDQASPIRVLSDRRLPPVEAQAGQIWPCWEIGGVRSVEPLAAAIAADDAPVVLLQHQPGLLTFEALALLAAHPALSGRVLLVTLHNTLNLLDLDPGLREQVLAGLARIDRVLVHTLPDLLRLRALGLGDKATLLPHGAPPPLPAGPAVVLDQDTRPPLIGSYGFFLPGKGIDILIEAFALLRHRWHGARLRLVNAEYDVETSRKEIARCKALAVSLGVAGAIEFETDFQPHFASLERLGACDLVALPYLPSKEASSAALRGALSCGAPVAVTPIALFDEAGGAVYRFGSCGVDAIAAGLDALLDDVAKRRALQAVARDWTAARQWPDVARTLDGLIEGLARTAAIVARRPGLAGSTGLVIG